jgi:hypothetical protein
MGKLSRVVCRSGQLKIVDYMTLLQWGLQEQVILIVAMSVVEG